MLDLAIGVPRDVHVRLAEVEHADPGWRDRALRAPGSLWNRAMASPAGALDVDVVNSDAWRTAEIGAVNAHASASALARLYAGLLVADERILPRTLLDEAVRTQTRGIDRLLEREVEWTLGFQREDGYVGMGGTGGSAAFLSERHGYAFAYVTRHLADHDRADALADVAETCA
jgi:hypothetical protein